MLKNNLTGQFPQTRLRRNRKSSWIRDTMQENQLHANDFIWPVFVTDIRAKMDQPVNAFVDTKTHSIDKLLPQLEDMMNLGLRSIFLFQAIDDSQKTDDGREAYNPDNFICNAIRRIKQELPELGVSTDVALDLYTTHGHDGLLDQTGHIANDASIEALVKQALAHIEAGADGVAPSDMMDGRIAAIRNTFDQHGFENHHIFSYSAKYESAFYVSYREALGSLSKLKGDKRTYQLNPANVQEAYREAAQDIQEGADALIIKPGQPYLDVLSNINQQFNIPTFAFQILCELTMLKCAQTHLGLDYEKALYESLIGFKRAGADAIISYATPDALKLIKNL